MNPLIAPLIGTWLLLGTDPATLTTEQITKHQVYVRIEEGKISGWTACNGFNADLLERDGQIRPHRMVKTAAFCDDERGEIERTLLSAVFALDNAKVEGDKLTLGQETTLTFRRTAEQITRKPKQPYHDLRFGWEGTTIRIFE